MDEEIKILSIDLTILIKKTKNSMELKSALPEIIGIIILTLKFSIGVNTPLITIQDVKKQWKDLCLGLIILIVLAPCVAIISILIFNPVKGAMLTVILLSASPGAPLSAIQVYKAGGNYAYAEIVQLLVAIVSVTTIPLVLYLFDLWLNIGMQVQWFVLAQQILLIVVLPLLLGIVFRKIFPNISAKYGKSLAKFTHLLLMVAGLLLLYALRNYLFDASYQDLLFYALFVTLNLLLGHILGGKNAKQKTSIALMSASRHLGIAIFIALIYFNINAIIASVIPYIVVNAVLGMIYIRWRKAKA